MKLTGNKMFEMVKEECEKYFEKLKKRKGVLFFINRNRKLGWYEDGDEKKDGKYVGEIENMKPNGQGTHTYSNGKKLLRQFLLQKNQKFQKLPSFSKTALRIFPFFQL